MAGRRSGTRWSIDAKGVLTGSEGFVVVECRRQTTSRAEQEDLGGLAYRILDAGASGGIIVSPLGIQEGAKRVAAAEGIIEVTLDENSTTTDYIMRFLGRTLAGASLSADTRAGATFAATVTREKDRTPSGD